MVTFLCHPIGRFVSYFLNGVETFQGSLLFLETKAPMAGFLRAFRRGSGFSAPRVRNSCFTHFSSSTHLERLGGADLRSATVRLSAGGSVGGAKVRRQSARWKLKKAETFPRLRVCGRVFSGERSLGFVTVWEIPAAVCLKTTSVSHNTQKCRVYGRT